MGSIIFILIFLGIIFKDSGHDKLRSDIFKWIILGSIGLSALTALVGSPFGLVAILFIVAHYVKKGTTYQKNKEKNQQFGWNAKEMENKWKEFTTGKASTSSPWENKNKESTNTGSFNTDLFGKKGKGNSKVLPRSLSKRKKILNSFNNKNDLYLTDEQVNSIVNSSYMSEIWRVELEAMTLKYETIYEWFQGNTDWLRAYMYVFHVQEITSDIKQQEKICIFAYEEIFRYVDELGSIPLYEKIAKVNSKFLTNFDDVSFMIAYRFLEKKGIYHTLESPDILKNESELDALLEKYKAEPSTMK